MRLAWAVAAAMAVVCARAEAAAITEITSVSYADNEGGYFSKTVIVPNFDFSLGTLISTTFTLTGSASETLSYSFPNTPPASGMFSNSVQINDRIFAQPGAQITAMSGQNGQLQNNFQVYASTVYDPSYNGTSPSLDFTFAVEASTLPFSATARAPINFAGSLTTSFQYTAVPEPLSAALLLAPALGLIASRRQPKLSR